MFIENRIKKETKQIVVFDFERSHREKLVIKIRVDLKNANQE